MKIIIYYEQRGYGGVDTHLAHLVNNWPEKKDEIIIVSNPDNEGLHFLQELLKNPRASVKVLQGVFADMRSEPSRIIRAFYRIRSLFVFRRKFRSLLEEYSPDILLANNGGFPGGLTNFLAALVGQQNPNTSLNTFFLIHHAPIVKQSGFFNFVAGTLVRKMQGVNIPCITVSQASKKALEQFTPLNNLKVIYNGIENNTEQNESYNFKEKWKISKQKVILGMIGPIVPHKGHATMLEVFRSSLILRQHSRLVVVGSGNKRFIERLNRIVQEYALEEQVIFTGFLPGDSCEIIRGFDLLLMPTSDFEGFGYSMAEAMISEIPVVASRVGAIPEVIVDGESGVLIEPDDIPSWRYTLESLVDNARDRERIAAAGKERIKTNFSAKAMSVQYYELLTTSNGIV